MKKYAFSAFVFLFISQTSLAVQFINKKNIAIQVTIEEVCRGKNVKIVTLYLKPNTEKDYKGAKLQPKKLYKAKFTIPRKKNGFGQNQCFKKNTKTVVIT